MKKTILYVFLSMTFLISPINADKLEDKTNEELIAEFLEISEKREKAQKRLKIEKEETKSAIEVNKKLDKVLNILSK
jgi:hypothetical protein